MSKRIHKLPTLPSALLMNERPVDDRYSAEELQEFRTGILTALNEAETDYELISAAVARHNNDPDDASPTFTISDDASRVLSMAELPVLAEQLRSRVRALRHALRRVHDHSFGTCCLTGRRISKEQLEKEPCTLLAAETKEKIMTLIETTS